MEKLSKYLFLGGIGGGLYYVIEILYRGYSHWTMFLLGGICFLFCGVQNNGSRRYRPLWKQALGSCLFVITGEFITGVIVNLMLGWNVWDYSMLPFNILGQICLPFVFIFQFLSLVAIILEDYLRYWIYGEEKPFYNIML